MTVGHPDLMFDPDVLLLLIQGIVGPCLKTNLRRLRCPHNNFENFYVQKLYDHRVHLLN